MKKPMGEGSRVRQRTIVVAVIMIFFVVAAPTSFAVLSQSHAGGKVVVRICGSPPRCPSAGGNNGKEPTNGGVAGRAHFTARGAITDKGTIVTYRWVKGSLPGGLITLRHVAVGKKGTITFVVKIDTSVGTSRWMIASGTKAYKGLHGQGNERENADYTVSTLTGTVSR
jgi:hypothetical protein